MIRQLLFIVVLACFSFSGYSQANQPASGARTASAQTSAGEKEKKAPNLTTVVQSIICGTNNIRRQKGLSPVRANEKLAQTARYFAEYLARTDTYGHRVDGSRPTERATNHGYAYCILSENIGYQYSSAGFTTAELARGFVTGWNDSPTHRENMLDPDVTDIGLAVAQSEQSGKFYAVQMFGRPSSLSIQFHVTNAASAPVEYQFGDKRYPLSPRQIRNHQVCRPNKLIFHVPGQEKPTTVHPKDGDRFTIVQENGTFHIRTKADESF